LPLLRQTEFDQLLWISDLNFVRGEDSLVRALWAGRPFVWHIYPQQDGAHRAKLDAFLSLVDAPKAVQDRHLRWNAWDAPASDGPLPLGHSSSVAREWQAWAAGLAPLLARQADLVTQLCAFVRRAESGGTAPKTR
jgi:hypothetical protein